MNKQPKPRVGISIGDPNGIGLEVIMKSLKNQDILEVCTPVIYASANLIKSYAQALQIKDFQFQVIRDTQQIPSKKVGVVNVVDKDYSLTLGEPTKASGQAAYESLKAAVEDLASTKVDVLVTAPIDKANIQSEDFAFPGHTEFLANYANTSEYLMLLMHQGLRVGTVTGHIPISEVSKRMTQELILEKLAVLNKSLTTDFSVNMPRIAVLGLNPHAGDNGLLGKEEENIIIPAIKKANEQGIRAFGPYAADGLFGSPNLERFDAVLAMYHDQGLAPFKSLAFNNGVNYTAGLPIVRTSPDHGTAFDIAGKNEASPDSMLAAIFAAVDISKRRSENKELEEGKLKPSKRRK